jgi:amino acid adenylation domain-containing protein
MRRRPGERLGELFEQLCDRAPGGGEHPAVDLGTEVLSYRDLDRRANRLARYLLDQGVGAGDRVGLLVVEPLDAYLGVLAIAKVHAAYVPLDAGFPVDRVGYILADAGADTLLVTRDAAGRVDGLDARMGELGTRALWLDEDTMRIAEQSPARLSRVERGEPADDLAYIIYTSGSTGRPKGVAIEHAAICNFVRVAGQVYGLRPDDRMYQGMTVAFDFSVEEIWVPWAASATLVPKPPGAALVGAELGQFLHDRRVTALCCVPTLLASVDVELPDLRFLLVSGEACPGHLVERWYRPDRRFLNVYGPTEACVTATYTPVHPRRPVTIGAPLPSYSVVLLDPEAPDRALPPGEVGEIGLAGIGLARGATARRRPPRCSSTTSCASRTTRRHASTAPATWAASPRTVRSSTWAASTGR